MTRKAKPLASKKKTVGPSSEVKMQGSVPPMKNLFPRICNHYGGNTAFKQENDEVSDVDPGRGEEYVHVEVMFRNSVSIENCEYRGLLVRSVR